MIRGEGLPWAAYGSLWLLYGAGSWLTRPLCVSSWQQCLPHPGLSEWASPMGLLCGTIEQDWIVKVSGAGRGRGYGAGSSVGDVNEMSLLAM